MAIRADRRVLSASLAFVWLATAAVSVWELNGQSMDLLRQAGLLNVPVMHGLILGGAAVDAVLGLALALRPSRSVCLVALAVMVAMTGLATLLEPSLWLHPLGPLTKNIPIAAVLWMLAATQKA